MSAHVRTHNPSYLSFLWSLHQHATAKHISLRIEALRGQAILAIREEYRDFSERLELVAGDEVAIIPPISGG
jgi:molybdopterin converting factor small subunit